MLRGKFVDTVFHDRYQRNNKRGGLKNLRCFPTCSASHRERGYCGRPIRVEVSGHIDDSNSLPVLYAEFTPLNKPQTFSPGMVTTLSQVESELVRSSAFPLRPFIKGDVLKQDGDGKVSFEFNPKRKGWHYGWTANKHSCNTLHALRVYVFSESNGVLICKDSFVSPGFILYCRRRKRFVKSPTAPIAPPANKKRPRATDTVTSSPKSSRTTPASSDCESESSLITVKCEPPLLEEIVAPPPSSSSSSKRIKLEAGMDDYSSLEAVAQCLLSLTQQHIVAA